MLVIPKKTGQTLRIGGDHPIEITFMTIQGDHALLTITNPHAIPIDGKVFATRKKKMTTDYRSNKAANHESVYRS